MIFKYLILLRFKKSLIIIRGGATQIALRQPGTHGTMRAMPKRELSLRHDESNLARLSLVLAQNRTKKTSWERTEQVDSIGVIKVACKAGQSLVVPHGVDNDILLGLINAAVIQGVPEDDTVRLTARQLLLLSGISPSARALANLKGSIDRLFFTSYKITDSWNDSAKGWRSVSFRLIAKHSESDSSSDTEVKEGQWRSESLLAIKLDDQLVKSIRAGYILPVDVVTLKKLRMPFTRVLFRTLNFQRVNAQSIRAGEFVVDLPAWAAHLGMDSDRPDTVMRALQPAHEDLIKNKFLKDVIYTGRGKGRKIHYIFENASLTDGFVMDTEIINLLKEIGFIDSNISSMITKHPGVIIRKCIDIYNNLKASGYSIKNPKALFYTILKNPDDFAAYENKAFKEKIIDASPAVSVARSEPLPEPLPEVTRKHQDGIVLLAGALSERSALALRDHVAELYVAGTLKAIDIVAMSRLTTSEIRASLEEKGLGLD